jgi:hypothetical protein
MIDTVYWFALFLAKSAVPPASPYGVAQAVGGGGQLEVALSEELLLSGGDAAAVQFSINGQAGRSFGGAREALDVRIGRDDYQRWLVGH